MSDGENIPPVPIEDRIKNEIPFLSNVMVVGDQRKFLTCLMTLKVLHFHTCIYPACSYSRAISTSSINSVSTIPLLPSLVACLVSPISAVARLTPTQGLQSVQVMCWSLRDGCEPYEKLSFRVFFFQQLTVLPSEALSGKGVVWEISKQLESQKPGQCCMMQWAERVDI